MISTNTTSRIASLLAGRRRSSKGTLTAANRVAAGVTNCTQGQVRAPAGTNRIVGNGRSSALGLDVAAVFGAIGWGDTHTSTRGACVAAVDVIEGADGSSDTNVVHTAGKRVARGIPN